LSPQVLVDTYWKIQFWYEESQTHEDADTLIPNQVLASVSNSANQKLRIWSPDTDVLLLLLDLVSYGRIATPT